MARPIAHTVEVAIRVPEGVLKRLKDEAQARGTGTVNQFIVQILIARDLGAPVWATATPAPEEPEVMDTATQLADEWL